MAVERLCPRRSEHRDERNHLRGDLHHYSEWCHLEWNRRLATAPLDAAAHDDGVAAAKKRMGRHRAQRQPTIMRASRSVPVETRLAASRTTTAPSGVNPAVSPKDLVGVRRALLRWYDKHRRDLPWRKTRDPYRIWLSEIMLQQTRVAAVLDHYRIFLDRFPNVQTLAAASEDAVLAAWSGLGYYR